MNELPDHVFSLVVAFACSFFELEVRIADTSLFTALACSVPLERVARGRCAAVLVKEQEPSPVFRTTTSYRLPPSFFQPIHMRVVEAIRGVFREADFNHAMLEHYSSECRTMAEHTDQAQDAEEGSWFAIFGCYRDAQAPCRELQIRNKQTGERQTIPMGDRCVVLFNTESNRRHVHKITGDAEWMALTLRLSKTRLTSGMRLANPAEVGEMRRLKGIENRDACFTWPVLNYTLSPGDLLMPVNANGRVLQPLS